MLLTVKYESHDASGHWWRSHTYHRIATKLRVTAASGREPVAQLA